MLVLPRGSDSHLHHHDRPSSHRFAAVIAQRCRHFSRPARGNLSPRAAELLPMRKAACPAIFSWPSFETTAFGGLLRMRSLIAAKPSIPHGEERRPCDASRTMRPRSWCREVSNAITLPRAGQGSAPRSPQEPANKRPTMCDGLEAICFGTGKMT